MDTFESIYVQKVLKNLQERCNFFLDDVIVMMSCDSDIGFNCNIISTAEKTTSATSFCQEIFLAPKVSAAAFNV